ncbi:DUF6550 family protein [Desulfitobacterium hafniense]|uniref:DUF6550 family protein n=1 Tax=Desulfitobacterium hafniense TaxID=49338 RepID=UPI0002D7180E|nr:DUF6550 family protein [Desulfitobacterium hafniense]
MKMTDKTKKWLSLAGLGAVGVVLVIAIVSQFGTEKVNEAVIQPSPAVSGDVNPGAEIPSSSDPAKTPEVSVPSVDPTAAPNAGRDTADSSGTEQSLQVEPSKPAAPAAPTPKPETSATNPGKPPEYRTDDTVKTQPTEPKGGETNNKGQVWVPGFGWVDDSGPNQGTVVDGEGDIDKQVGTME